MWLISKGELPPHMAPAIFVQKKPAYAIKNFYQMVNVQKITITNFR